MILCLMKKKANPCLKFLSKPPNFLHLPRPNMNTDYSKALSSLTKYTCLYDDLKPQLWAPFKPQGPLHLCSGWVELLSIQWCLLLPPILILPVYHQDAKPALLTMPIPKNYNFSDNGVADLGETEADLLTIFLHDSAHPCRRMTAITVCANTLSVSK